MNLDINWVPMNWPCGPLDQAQRERAKTATDGLKDALQAWAQPAALEKLEATPVNCLVVEWAAGVPEDSAQQEVVKSLVQAGTQLGLKFVGRIGTGEGAKAAIASAHAAGLAAIILAEPKDAPPGASAILQTTRDKVEWRSVTPIFVTTDNDWPGFRLDTMRGNTAVAGPTGIPWLNSNGWFAMLAKAMAPSRAAWLDFDPPASSGAAHAANYPMAVADGRAYGARWIISLEDHFRTAFANGDSAASAVWAKTCQTLAFFEHHKEWDELRPVGSVAVISDFHSDNIYTGGETLNLLNRRGVLFRIVPKSRAFATPLTGVKAALWADPDKPRSEQLTKCLEFVRQGGLLIAPSYWGPAGITPTRKDPSLDYAMYTLGQGQIAVSSEGLKDPYKVALDTHLLVSRRNDLVRLFNPDTVNFHAVIDAALKKQVVQVINYAPKPATYVTLWLNGHASPGRLFTPEAKDVQTLPARPGDPGTEFELPPIGVTCAVEVEV